MKIVESKYKWKTKDGKEIDIDDMTTEHIAKAISITTNRIRRSRKSIETNNTLREKLIQELAQREDATKQFIEDITEIGDSEVIILVDNMQIAEINSMEDSKEELSKLIDERKVFKYAYV